MTRALEGEEIETFRPLLPVGYRDTAIAYQKALACVGVADLSEHYTTGLDWFQQDFVPHVKGVLANLTGGEWDLGDYVAFASGSDVDLMSHILNATTLVKPVTIYPGDWYGFRVGANQPDRVQFTSRSNGSMACLCIPSVRNGHLTAQMFEFLDAADSCLLNINLFPTLETQERHSIARVLQPILKKSFISISFSRGFALTASQLGLVLIHRDNPFIGRFRQQLDWFTYFYNSIAAQAFIHLNVAQMQRVDELRRKWVADWLHQHGLPSIESGTYYVKSFQLKGQLPDRLVPLMRDGLVRLCFKPPIIDSGT